jgi:hypothetical protein
VSLANALASNTTLRELNLPNYYSAYNDSITSRGLQTFSVILDNPNIALERLDFAAEYSDSVVVDNSIICSFANALINNNKLRELMFCSKSLEENVGHFVNSITSVGLMQSVELCAIHPLFSTPIIPITHLRNSVKIKKLLFCRQISDHCCNTI